MLLAINGATTMKATLPEDIAAASAAGFKALEIWARKMDAYLEANAVEKLEALFDRANLLPASINSIEFITFRPPEEYQEIKARCRELCRLVVDAGERQLEPLLEEYGAGSPRS